MDARVLYVLLPSALAPDVAALRAWVWARLPDEEELRDERLVAAVLLVADARLLEDERLGRLPGEERDERLVADERSPVGGLLVVDEAFPEDELLVRDERALPDVLVRAALPGEPPGPGGSLGSELARDAAR